MVDIQKAIIRKQQYACLDAVVSDSLLARALNVTFCSDELLTLPGCLLSDAPKPFPPICLFESLDDNLRALQPIIRSRGKLAKQLLNAPQFLNTLSELAFARTLQESGWSISLNKKFFGNKDVDIFARQSTEVNFIDVVNIGLLTLPTGVTICRDVFQETFDRTRIVQKLVAKYQEKFEPAINSGWGGRPWVALDFAKNHEEDIQAFVRDLFQPHWRSHVVELGRRKCPKLAGVILYRYDPTFGPRVNSMSWHMFN